MDEEETAQVVATLLQMMPLWPFQFSLAFMMEIVVVVVVVPSKQALSPMKKWCDVSYLG